VGAANGAGAGAVNGAGAGVANGAATGAANGAGAGAGMGAATGAAAYWTGAGAGGWKPPMRPPDDSGIKSGAGGGAVISSWNVVGALVLPYTTILPPTIP
jgi:hypothetical protein